MEVAFHRDKFDCRHCRHQRHCDDRNPAAFPMFVIPEIALESRVCLLPMVDDDSRLMLRLYGHYKNHLLPAAGGLLDQPNLFLEAMEVIDAHQSKLVSQETEKAGRG